LNKKVKRENQHCLTSLQMEGRLSIGRSHHRDKLPLSKGIKTHTLDKSEAQGKYTKRLQHSGGSSTNRAWGIGYGTGLHGASQENQLHIRAVNN